jgi:mRNA interferase MazF
MKGDFGKPSQAKPSQAQPSLALIIQSHQFDLSANVTLLLLSGALREAPQVRLTMEPTKSNDLRKVSQIMIDKTMTVRRDKIGPVFGRLDDEAMLSITRLRALFLGFA